MPTHTIGISHVDGPAVYVFKLTIQPTLVMNTNRDSVTLRLNRKDAGTLCLALIHNVQEMGWDIRGKQWTLAHRTIEVCPDPDRCTRLNRDGEYHENEYLEERLTDDWGPRSWRALAVRLAAFSGAGVNLTHPG